VSTLSEVEHAPPPLRWGGLTNTASLVRYKAVLNGFNSGRYDARYKREEVVMKEIAKLCLILGVLILLAMGPEESAAEEVINFNLEYFFPENQYSDCYWAYAGKFITPLLVLLNISPANSEQVLFKSYDISLKFFIVTFPDTSQVKPVIAIMLDRIRFPIWTIVIDPGDSEEEIQRKASTAAGVTFLRIKNLEELIK